MKLHTYYDLRYGPITFDFASFLVLSNALRQKLKLKYLSVQIINFQYRNRSKREKASSIAERKFRVLNILCKLPHLIPEVIDFKLNNDNLDKINFPAFPGGYPPSQNQEFKLPYTMDYLREFYNDDEINLRPFKSSDWANKLINNNFDSNTITISLRTTKFDDIRNSNLEEWYKVYKTIKGGKYRPIIIPDIEDIMGEKKFSKFDWEVFIPASMDLDLRLALYERSFDNLSLNNGISSLLYFSNSFYKVFKFVTPGSNTASTEHHKRFLDINWGENLKFSSKNHQTIIWDQDSYEVIMKNLNYL